MVIDLADLESDLVVYGGRSVIADVYDSDAGPRGKEHRILKPSPRGLV